MITRIVSLVVAGLFFVGIGLMSLLDPSVKCGGQNQKAGQVCVSDTGTRGVSAQRKENQQEGWMYLTLGGLALAGAAYGAARGNRSQGTTGDHTNWR